MPSSAPSRARPADGDVSQNLPKPDAPRSDALVRGGGCCRGHDQKWRGIARQPRPPDSGRALARFQDNVVTDAKITIPFDPWGQEVTLDPHRTVNWGPFWVMFPNVWGGLAPIRPEWRGRKRSGREFRGQRRRGNLYVQDQARSAVCFGKSGERGCVHL